MPVAPGARGYAWLSVICSRRLFELEGDEAIVRKEGNRLIVEPIIKTGLLEVLSRLKPVKYEFPDIDTGPGTLDDINLQPGGDDTGGSALALSLAWVRQPAPRSPAARHAAPPELRRREPVRPGSRFEQTAITAVSTGKRGLRRIHTSTTVADRRRG